MTDLHLPKNDGLEILAAARASAEFADVPVAVLSGSDSPEERERVVAFKASCFLAKPTDLDGFSEIGRRIKELAMDVLEVTSKAAP